MLKLTIEVKDKQDGSCSVQLKTPKDLSKATETEKSTGAVVYNNIAHTLKVLEENKEN